MTNDDTRQQTRRDWVVSQAKYRNALEAVDRTGERWAHNTTPNNRAHFDVAMSHLRQVEQDLYEQWNKENPS
jgi:hypothetical protein